MWSRAGALSLMNFDNRKRQGYETASPGSVGTRGGVEWMWGPCACPRGPHVIRRGIRKSQRHRPATRTSTRPPPNPASTPCPYRAGGERFPVIAAFGRQISSEPERSVCLIPGFDRECSSGQDTARGVATYGKGGLKNAVYTGGASALYGAR